MRPRRRVAGSPGFILLEAATTYVIVAFSIVALIPVFLMAVKANATSEQTLVATGLAHELLEEIRLRKWDEQVPNARPWYPAYSRSAVGIDGGEDAADKTTFDDVDDFHGWAEAPPKDPLGRDVAGLASYSRSVTVSYVTSALEASGSPTDYKLVKVCVKKGALTRVCLEWLATNS